MTSMWIIPLKHATCQSLCISRTLAKGKKDRTPDLRWQSQDAFLHELYTVAIDCMIY